MKATVIVATSINGVIGIDGKIPWKCKGDMEHFKKTTNGSTVIMGRTTYESIGKPLPNRKNVVLTRDTTKYLKEKYEGKHKDVFFKDNLRDAVKTGSLLGKTFIIGGSQVYELAFALNLVDEVILTTIKKYYEGDAFFTLEPGWSPIQTVESNEEYDIVLFKRK